MQGIASRLVLEPLTVDRPRRSAIEASPVELTGAT
jgi:hypothetical protein